MYKVIGFAAILVLFTCVLNDVKAQSNPQDSYLFEVGKVDSVYSTILNEQRQFWIHLPNQGNLVEGKQYPVIYLLDGGVHLGGLAMVQEYYNYFRLPEMIVVGISNRVHRTRDLTPTVIESRHGGIMAEESGGSEAFTSFIADELIPLIDSKYPTTIHRTLIGHSYAGLFAVNTLVYHPELFTNYVAIDPSLDWGDQRWMERALHFAATSNYSGKGLHVSMANEIVRFSDQLTIDDVSSDTTEFSLGVRSALQFVKQFEVDPPQGLRFAWKFYEEDIHGSIPLVGMRDGLVFLYDFWRLKTPSLYNDPNTSTAKIVSLIRAQSEAQTTGLGYSSLMDEGLLDMLGHMSMDSNQPEKARAVFEISAEYYKESESAHASMVKICLLLVNLECAMEHAQLADRIAGGSEYVDQVKSTPGKKQ
jgi:uncharacterized protein